jgi:hypothetical protein
MEITAITVRQRTVHSSEAGLWACCTLQALPDDFLNEFDDRAETRESNDGKWPVEKIEPRHSNKRLKDA